jgi:aryl-alcohol dehydrogenase-like predicted oxidoreductase
VNGGQYIDAQSLPSLPHWSFPDAPRIVAFRASPESAMSTTPLPRRRLAESLEVTALGFGAMGMSDFYGPSDRASNLAVLHRVLDLGVNFIDSADMYGCGANERLLAEVLKTRRDEVVLATKFGNVRAPDGRVVGICGRPEYVYVACEASLARLGVDCIDLYYQHRVDPGVPIEETVGAMQRLVEAGKVRHLGLSEASAETLRRASKVAPIAVLQTEYSLWSRDVEAEVLPACRELGIGFVPYSPLGRGFLTGAIASAEQLDADDRRRAHPRFQAKHAAANQALVERLRGWAVEIDCTPAQLALAWLLHQGRDIVPIPGTRSIARLEENLAAAHLALPAELAARMRAELDAIAISGGRYPPEGMALVNR